MKWSSKALAWAAACWLASAQAQAQSPDSATRVYQPSAQPVAYHSSLGEACTDPSCDAAGACADPTCAFDPSCGYGEAGCGSAGCCNSGCGGGGLFSCCPHGDPWKLFEFSQCRADRGWSAGGWLAQSFTWNPDNPTDGFNGPVTFLDRANEYQMNQFNLYLEKATDTGGCGFDIGGRVDALYGTDHRFTTATGLETNGDFTQNWNGNNRFYGLAMPQFYAEIAYNNTKTKIGHFYSPVGYFVVPATGNFFNTMPYTFQYGEPFTHTGFLTTWAATDKLTLGAGFVKGWDNFDHKLHSHGGYLGTLGYTFEGGASINIVHVITQEPSFVASATNGGFSQRFLQTFVFQKPITDKLTYVMHSDYGRQLNTTAAGNTAEWYGANQYLFYQMNDCWAWGVNFEWFRDDDGVRVGTLTANTGNGSTRSAPLGAPGGFAGDFYQLTVGPKWTPTANLTVRPNARWDWYNGDLPGGAQPYDAGTDNNQFILGTDVIVSF